MKIWALTKTSPQHIGNATGHETSADILAAASSARHTGLRVAVRATIGNRVAFYLFDTKEHFINFQAANPDIKFSDLAA